MNLAALTPWTLLVALALPATAAASDPLASRPASARGLRATVRDRLLRANPNGVLGRGVDAALGLRARAADRRAARRGSGGTTVRGVLRAAVRVELRERAVASAAEREGVVQGELASAERGLAQAHVAHDRLFDTRRAIASRRDHARAAVTESLATGDTARAANAQEAADALTRLGLGAGAYMNAHTGKALRAALGERDATRLVLASAHGATRDARTARDESAVGLAHETARATPGQRRAAALLRDRTVARRQAR